MPALQSGLCAGPVVEGRVQHGGPAAAVGLGLAQSGLAQVVPQGATGRRLVLPWAGLGGWPRRRSRNRRGTRSRRPGARAATPPACQPCGRAGPRSARGSRRRSPRWHSGDAGAGRSRRRRSRGAPAGRTAICTEVCAERCAATNPPPGRQQTRPCAARQLLYQRFDLAGQTGGTSLVSLQHPGHLLSEGTAAATRGTHQTPHPHANHGPPPVHRHISHGPQVITMHTAGRRPAARARNQIIRRPSPHQDPLTLVGHVLNDQRRQSRKHHIYKLVDISHVTPTAHHHPQSPPNVRQGC